MALLQSGRQAKALICTGLPPSSLHCCSQLKPRPHHTAPYIISAMPGASLASSSSSTHQGCARSSSVAAASKGFGPSKPEPDPCPCSSGKSYKVGRLDFCVSGAVGSPDPGCCLTQGATG